MLRITTHVTRESLTFQLEGKLVGPWVAELGDCWRSTARDGKRVVNIDLRAVTYVDSAGKELLAELHRHGARFLAFDCQMKALVAEIKSARVKSPPEERNDHASGTARPTP